MMPRSRMAALAMQSAFRLFALFPPVRDYFGQMKYKPKPMFRSGFLSRDCVPDAAGRVVGRLLPQPMVETADGMRRLDDVLGNGFALLAPSGTSPDVFASVPDDFGRPLGVSRVAVAGAIPNSRPGVLTIRDPNAMPYVAGASGRSAPAPAPIGTSRRFCPPIRCGRVSTVFDICLRRHGTATTRTARLPTWPVTR